MTTIGSVHRRRHQVQSHALTHPGSNGATGAFATLMGRHLSSAPQVLSQVKCSPTAIPVATAAAPAIAGAYGKFLGHSTGTGQCVALVRATNPTIGSTASWVRGAPVEGNAGLQPGTAIATFAASGRYTNSTDGSSHSAIYLGQNALGVQVLDQWAGNPAAVRTIPWDNPGAAAADTGSAFYVIRTSQTLSA